MNARVCIFLMLQLLGSGICPGIAAEQSFRVRHLPETPRSGDKVIITVQPASAVESAQLEYQVVLPGNYVPLADPAYTRSWTNIAMQKSGDSLHAEIPASVQMHRTLVRYRVRVTDANSKTLQLPSSDDTQHNYAYFVYDGIPAWAAALFPNGGGREKEVIQFPAEVMGQVQSYFLIARIKDVENATWYRQSFDKEYHYTGTFVADGKVYDHVQFRARGGVWRYSMGKNMWKFNFNKGHHLQAKDDYGNPYQTRWDKLNLRACIQQGDFGRRGEQGMYEAVGFRLFNLAEVDSPRTHWITLRIVGEKEEAPANQYRGDFWGLYLAIENEDENFLQEHHLPDGHVYKMMFGQGELSNSKGGQPDSTTDLQRFQSGLYSGRQSEAWWRQNVDLPLYYSYRSIVEAIHHYDISDGKNYDFYFDAKNGRCHVIPWDIDLTWGDHMYGGGHDPFYRALSLPNLKIEYQNRLREIRDLLYHPSETDRLIDECAAIISRPPGGLSIVDADRYKWDYHPIMSSRYIMGGKSAPGLFYQASPTHDFAGMVQQMKQYVQHRSSYIDRALLADPAVPATPAIRYTGAQGFPQNDLTFSTTALSGNAAFAAMEWRVGQIDRPALKQKPSQPGHYEITPIWQSAELNAFKDQITVPADKLHPGQTYRARCRIKDNTGRWSHWSEPVEFSPGR